MTERELLVKIASFLRVPTYELVDGCLSYHKAIIEELLAEIKVIIEKNAE
mgnify:CR=1 FL=1